MARIKSTENNSKREVIIKEASKLFKEKGFTATSMRDLAERVGVEAPSLYNHIQSKSELLKIICSNVGEKFAVKIAEIEQTKIPAIEKVEKLLRFHIQEMINYYEEEYVSGREWRYLKDPYLSEYREQRRNYRKRFTSIIQQGIDQKEIKEIDANTAVLILLNAITSIDQWHRIVHKVSSKELEENIVTILIEGLRNN
ncbi:MAG: TetR/AcrR family transcriptional regulator [Segetibacter sp.]|jgi:AcrR family transcriptional regulator|nr:TetR/AcrR family transcriptional regulator [Segetibacter sp.]